MDRRANRWLSDLPLWLAGGSALLFLVSIAAALLVAEAEVDAAGSDDASGGAQAAYELRLDPAGGVVRLRGLIDFGVTRDLEALLLAAPQARVIRLESAGGRVAEARGLARLVRRMALDTSASGECSSACTLVLLSGRTRYLEPGATVGFHQYGLHSPLLRVFIDPAAEQARDEALFAHHDVDPAFLTRVAEVPHREMWFPWPEQLLAAGAVDVLGRPDTSPIELSDRAGSPPPR
jgi:hypothetical protein